MARSVITPSRRVSTIPAPTRVLRSRTARLSTISASTRVLRSQTIHLNTNHQPHTILKAQKGAKCKPKPRPNPRLPPRTHFTCRICVSSLPRGHFIPWIKSRVRHRYRDALEVPIDCISHLASHPLRGNDPVCRACIGAYMSVRLDGHGARWVGIGCVEPGCRVVWSWKMVIAFLPQERMEEYNIALFKDWQADAGLFTCLAPGCDFTGLLDNRARGYPHVSCNACNFRACGECRIPWHEGQTCAEFSAAAVTARLSEDEMETLRQVQERGGKRCPNCQLVVEKDGGCPSMFCPGCRRAFNWDAAASTVPSAKRALPVKSGKAGHEILGFEGCEVDDEQGKFGQDDFERYMRDIGSCGIMPEGFDPIAMPLPDEEDVDL